MKILIVNKFFYPRGGDCIYTMNLARLLRANGHEVLFYAMDYPKNLQCGEVLYFAKEVNFSAKRISDQLKAAARILWGTGVKRNFKKLLDDFHPDIVHLNNIHSYLSPIVAKLAHEHGIRVLWTLHDYKLICPSYTCLYQGKVCEECISHKYKVILRKCMKESFTASVLAGWEAVNWNKAKLCQWTDAFICPSHFMASKMLQGGFPAEKLHVNGNFITQEIAMQISAIPFQQPQKAYAYIGRLSPEKGIESLLKVANKLPYKLYIAGNGPLEEELRQKYASDTLVFLGHLTTEQTIVWMKDVQFTILPSIWYENNPLSIIESLCCGTPVLGRRIGGIPELLETNACNRLFTQENELPAAITEMFASSEHIDRAKLSAVSLQRFSAERYYQEWKLQADALF